MTDHPSPDHFRPALARLAAGALFMDEAGRVLLVEPSYKQGWDLPGGYVEPGESPHTACAREVEEELSIKPQIGGLLVVDWAPHPVDGDKLLFVFDGGYPAGRIQPDGSEINRAEFHGLDRLPDLLIPRLLRRVLAAVAARKAGHPVYLEHGRACTS